MIHMILIGLLFAGSAQAGAWPRDKGTWFASAAVRLAWPKELLSLSEPSQYYTLYLEYGLTQSLTLGLDTGRSVSGAGKTVLFLRYPLRNRDTGVKLAVELGAGKIDGVPVIRPGFNFGYGFSARRGSGWFSIDTVAEIDITSLQTDYKADITFGRTLPNGNKWIMQMQSGKPAQQEVFARLAPSLIIDIGKGRMAEVGFTWGLKNDRDIGLKLGLWHHF